MFYKLNASRVTMREFWWETKLFAWVGLLVKLFRIRLRGSSDDLAVDSLHPFLVDQDKIAPDMFKRFAPTLKQLELLGFSQPFWHAQENIFQATRNTLATVRHESGVVWARVQCRTNFGRVPARVKFFTTFISRTPDGFICTGNGKYDMAWPRTHDTVRFRLMNVDQLWARHQQRIGASARPITRDQLLDVAEEYHASLRDFHLARGVFEPLGEEELLINPPTALSAEPEIGALPEVVTTTNADGTPRQTPVQLAAPPDLMEIATLDELRRLQNKKVNWRSAVGLLTLSAVLFIAMSRSGNREEGWEYVGIIVGILLFHELGHYLAMKIFGYRNLRMFFIPGFGAAVSGRHYNAPAWKKIIVSLMGPLPGIAAGIVLLSLTGFLHNELLYRIGLFAIIINLFNLIPILPFDGGWVAHAAIFSRHPKLDVGFRLTAALLLILIGMKVPGMHVLIFVAIISLLALPVANKLAMTVSELRKMPALGVSPDSQTIPPETARIILAKLRQKFTRNFWAKAAAQHVASVFESLNARPPSVAATIGLLSLHATAFLLALLVGAVAIVVHQRSPFHRPLYDPAKFTVTVDEIESSGHSPTGQRNTIIARFKDNRAAQAAFAEWVSPMPACRFGQTLLMSFGPTEFSSQRNCFARFEKSADDVFVESPRMRANVEMTFKLPNTESGRQALRDLELYLQGIGWRLIPPWAAETDWPAPQRAAQTALRELVKELQTAPLDRSEDRRKRWKEIAEAQRRGDPSEAERLQAQAKQADEESERTKEQRLLQQYGHPDLIEKWAQIRTTKDWAKRTDSLKQEIAPLLGQWPVERSDDLLVVEGFASNSTLRGPRLYCRFAHTDIGLASMTRWLFSRGATDVHYVITGISTLPDGSNVDEN